MGAGYGKVASAQISSENNQIIFIPKGVAHGFLALSDQALMIYKTSTTHAPESDFGIAWDTLESAGIEFIGSPEDGPGVRLFTKE